MTHPNEDLVRQLYKAQGRGDLEAYLGFLSDDIVLYIPGRSRIADSYRGKDEIRRHFKEIQELSGGTFRTKVHDVLASDEHVVALVEASAQKGDVTSDLPRVHVWHVRNGKLTEVWLHPLDQYEFDDYWGSSSTKG